MLLNKLNKRNSVSSVVQRRSRASGVSAFTIVELLVVFAVIVLLVGLLLPALKAARDIGKSTEQKSQISKLDQACEAYYQVFDAYPGPLPNKHLGFPKHGSGGEWTDVSGTENLYYGLAGLHGLGPTEPPFDSYTFPGDLRGPGPEDDPTGSVVQHEPFYKFRSGEVDTSASANKEWHETDNRMEIWDVFSDPLPLLYFRANVGMGKPAGKSKYDEYQYCVSDNFGYYIHWAGTAPEFPEGFTEHYLVSDTTSGTGEDGYDHWEDMVTDDRTEEAHNKDRFLLISAGRDREWGTEDDVTNFDWGE